MDRRTSIVEAARAILNEGGPHQISVRAVAARAGIGASTLRHYFPTQEGLYDAVVEATFDEALSHFRLHDSTVPARERLAECLWQFVPAGEQRDAGLRQWLTVMATATGPEAKPEQRRRLTLMMDRAFDAVAGWLRVLELEGALAPGPLERHVRLLLVAVDGLAMWLLFAPPGQDQGEADAVMLAVVDAVLR